MSEQSTTPAQPDRYTDPAYCQALEQERDYLRERVARLEQVHREDVRQLDKLSEAESRHLKAEAQLGNQSEAAEILRTLIKNIEQQVHYSVETTCVFLRQALLCFGLAPSGEAHVGPVAPSIPDEVKAWFHAKLAHINAVEAYNRRLAFVREHMPFGTSVDLEYQLMEKAEREARGLLNPMFVALQAYIGDPEPPVTA